MTVFERCGRFTLNLEWQWMNGRLLDVSMATIGDEENAGTGADHMREKNRQWAILLPLYLAQYAPQEISGLTGQLGSDAPDVVTWPSGCSCFVQLIRQTKAICLLSVW